MLRSKKAIEEVIVSSSIDNDENQPIIDQLFGQLTNAFNGDFDEEDVKYAFKVYVECLTETLKENLITYFHPEQL